MTDEQKARAKYLLEKMNRGTAASRGGPLPAEPPTQPPVSKEEKAELKQKVERETPVIAQQPPEGQRYVHDTARSLADRLVRARSPKFGILDLDLYDLPDVAERTGFSLQTLRREIDKGRLKVFGIRGGRGGTRVLKSALIAWLSHDPDGAPLEFRDDETANDS
jgi:hypothetical protein